MPHTDPEVLALRALGESAGGAADEDHITGCVDCRAELAHLKDVVATARRDGPARLTRPPARVWDQIAAATGVAEPLPALAQPPTEPASPQQAADDRHPSQAGQAGDSPAIVEPGPRPGPARRPAARRGRMRIRLAVAAAAGIVVGAGAAAGIARLVAAPAPAVQTIARIQLRPLAQFPQWQGASGTAVMRLASATRVLDVTLSAPQKPGFYEVWLLGRDGVSMVSLGDLSSGHVGSFTIPAGADLRFYSRIDISLQPFDGSTVHSKTSVVRGSLPAAVAGGS